MRNWILAALPLALAACGFEGTDRNADEDTAADRATASHDNLADTMASADPAPGEKAPIDIPDPEERPIMQLQVVLDREGFGPGVIDGKMGMSTENALRGFQEANDLDVTGKHDDATKQALAQWDNISATRVVTIPDEWGELDFVDIPEETAAKAEMESLGYTSLDEKLAERFHTTVEVLQMLNPGGKPAGMDTISPEGNGDDRRMATATSMPSPANSADDTSETGAIFAAGQQIRVPNIGADRIAPDAVADRGWQNTLQALGVGTDQPEVDRIVVSKSGGTLKAFQGDKLVALFTVTTGSRQFPLPIGEWDILGKGYNPPYSYDPEVLDGEGTEGETYTLPPGPNGPVGVVWIDLSKEHYGIHGTPDPETIGRAESHGCVRLTNWDAARLTQMVSTSTQVIFEA